MIEIPKIKLPKDLEISEVVEKPFSESNEVFRCKGFFQGKTTSFFLKVPKNIESNLCNEISILGRLAESHIAVPRIISYSVGDPLYVAFEEVSGRPVYKIINPEQNVSKKTQSEYYAHKFGESLGQIHNLKLNWKPVKKRRFHEYLEINALNDKRFAELDGALKRTQPENKEHIFIHGDHHYANVLWEKREISGILDWELCEVGWCEFDLAWMVIVRPRQEFFKSLSDREAFLEGYRRKACYENEQLVWCEILIYLHFAYSAKRRKELEYTDFAIMRAQNLVSKL